MQSQFGAGRPQLFLKCALAGIGIGVRHGRREAYQEEAALW